MARRKSSKGEADKEPDLDISSLIDVCFLLLIYFIVTSTITRKETDLGMALPSGAPSTDKQPEIDPMLITVSSSGALSSGSGSSVMPLDANPKVRDVPLLDSQLSLYSAAAKSADNEPLVQIYVDGDATQQRVIDVLNALAAVGIKSVTFTELID